MRQTIRFACSLTLVALFLGHTAAQAALRHTNNLRVTSVVAVAGDRTATVTWMAPVGKVVTGYSVVAHRAVYDPVLKRNVRQTTAPVSVTDPTQTWATFTQLSNGYWYDFTVTAFNTVEWTAVNTNNVKNGGMVKPSGLPQTINTIQTVAANRKITVQWNRGNNGGATQTFAVSMFKDGQFVLTRPGIKDNRSYPYTVFTGLTNGSSYTFTVTSTNVNGSVTSQTSQPATPRT